MIISVDVHPVNCRDIFWSNFRENDTYLWFCSWFSRLQLPRSTFSVLNQGACITPWPSVFPQYTDTSASSLDSVLIFCCFQMPFSSWAFLLTCLTSVKLTQCYLGMTLTPLRLVTYTCHKIMSRHLRWEFWSRHRGCESPAGKNQSLEENFAAWSKNYLRGIFIHPCLVFAN